MQDARVAVGGGRQLAYTDIGDPGGRCVVFFDGAPMSRLHLVGMEGQFAAQGLRVVSPDRPGYGGSSPQVGRSMADWPKDVAALVDALGIDRFMVAGHSSGGPYAVACAAVLVDRGCAKRFGTDGSGFLEPPLAFPEPDLPLLADETLARGA
jgi:pimeloyl-ACP methyl ester carboxylesterase